MADDREEIRARIDIVDLVGQRVNLRRSGKGYVGLCPFHDDRTPSFHVTPSIGRYQCFACGEKGDIFTWVQKTQNMSFREALEYLAERAGVTLSKGASPEQRSMRTRYREAMEMALRFFQDQLGKSETARTYCENRGLDRAVLQGWEIGYAPDLRDGLTAYLARNGVKLEEARDVFLTEHSQGGGFHDKFWNRLMFAIRDERGDLVAFGGRLLGDGHPKYINSGDTPLFRKSRVLYGMNRARDPMSKTRRAVLVEGYLDVIACHRAGVDTAVASLGTALAEDQAKLLKRFADEAVILYDADGAGIKAAERAVPILQAEGFRVRVGLMPDGEDPDTLLRKKGPEAVQAAVDEAGGPVEFFISRLEAKHPTKDDTFWAEAVDTLRTSSNPVEVERQIERLVGRYAAVRDQAAVRESLRERVLRGRRRVAQRARSSLAAMQSPLPPAEIVIFAALTDPRLRVAAWEVIKHPRLIRSPLGQAARMDLLECLKDCPQDETSVWVPRLSEETQTRFLEIETDPRYAGANLDLKGAIAKLEEQLARELLDAEKPTASNDEASLRAWADRLRNLKRSTGGDPS